MSKHSRGPIASPALGLTCATGKRFGRPVAELTRCSPTSKTGNLTSLAFPTILHANPRIVLAGSSAFGNRGPWEHPDGLRATGAPPPGSPVLGHPRRRTRHPYDATTIFPDHVVGGLVAEALIHRDRTGGTSPHSRSRRQSARTPCSLPRPPRARPTRSDTSACGFSSCAGDDEWCVILRSDEWRRATSAFGPFRITNDPRFGHAWPTVRSWYAVMA